MALVRGGTVLPHVQAFADAVSKATGADSFGTYAGHDPSLERALDIFVPVSSDVLGNKITAFAIANLDRFGIWYVIYRQRIYNPQIADYWRAMEDRGSATQNHFDHVHVSFEATAPVPQPPTPPTPKPQEEVTMIVFDGPPERGGGVWKSDGVFRNRIHAGTTWPALEAAGAKHIGVAPVGLFDDLIDADDLRGVNDDGVELSTIADRVAARVADLIADRLAS